ncbi:TetR/AcrR family transcriptional regulator [Kitasatospora sp. NPDC002227]|uniref:TetR/AcrR family transcriptional regulator n=1 Tax=Kitasatospora sp. NPDC002227 TaxID=3154773 RepID=UPI00332A1503
MQSVAPVIGRRARNRQRVQERLYEAGLSLITAQGYDRTSIEEIAERADVARGTFFNYFQRKEDLVTEWGERRRVRLADALLAGGSPRGDGLGARLEHFMTVLGRVSEEEREVTVAMLTAWVKAGRPLLEEPYVAETFGRILAEGAVRGELRDGVGPQQVGEVLRDLYVGTLYRWSREVPVAERGALEAELLAVLRLLVEGVVARRDPEVTP